MLSVAFGMVRQSVVMMSAFRLRVTAPAAKLAYSNLKRNFTNDGFIFLNSEEAGRNFLRTSSNIFNSYIRKDCWQNKSKFISEDHFTKHMNITIH